MSSKRIIFIGAGAVGSYLGGWLSHTGHEVDLIGKLADESGPTQRGGAEQRIGDRTRVQIDVTNSPDVVTDPFPSSRQRLADLPELEMRAVSHVDARCPADWVPVPR